MLTTTLFPVCLLISLSSYSLCAIKKSLQPFAVLIRDNKLLHREQVRASLSLI